MTQQAASLADDEAIQSYTFTNNEAISSYVFTDTALLCRALTHSSFVYENHLGIKDSNERLEFLGDAVLELLTSELLYNQYPKLTEGELSKGRANLVCEPSLAAHARKLGLGHHLRLGRGETASGGAEKDSILSNALEAVIGAVYLDGGLKAARAFVKSLFDEQTLNECLGHDIITDPKSNLQEKLQKTSRIPLIYTITNEVGPAHQKEFTATVSHNGQVLGTGTGKSKKDAERNAAIEALKGSNSL